MGTALDLLAWGAVAVLWISLLGLPLLALGYLIRDWRKGRQEMAGGGRLMVNDVKKGIATTLDELGEMLERKWILPAFLLTVAGVRTVWAVIEKGALTEPAMFAIVGGVAFVSLILIAFIVGRRHEREGISADLARLVFVSMAMVTISMTGWVLYDDMGVKLDNDAGWDRLFPLVKGWAAFAMVSALYGLGRFSARWSEAAEATPKLEPGTEEAENA